MNKSKLRFLLGFIVCFYSISGISQDLITKKDGTDIQAKVLEVNISEVKYKKFDNIEGTTFKILKSDIVLIRYQNGTKDIFTNQQPSTVSNQTNPVSSSPTYPNSTKSPSYIQESKEESSVFNLYYQLIASVPIGNFADNNFGGGAKFGFGIGGDGINSMPSTKSIRFSVMFSSSWSYNAGSNSDGTSNWAYSCLWIYPGVIMQMGNPNLSFYTHLNLGLNYTILQGDLNPYGNALAVCFSAGAGLTVKKHFEIGLRYLGATPSFKDKNGSQLTQKISTLHFVIGYNF